MRVRITEPLWYSRDSCDLGITAVSLYTHYTIHSTDSRNSFEYTAMARREGLQFNIRMSVQIFDNLPKLQTIKQLDRVSVQERSPVSKQ